MEQRGAGETSLAQDAESHFATLVKFDTVQSTRTARGLSRPDHLELVRGFRATVAEVLEPYAVRIEWDGDGALVVFGYPEVRVDAPEVAVRTALRLVDAVARATLLPGVRLELTVGVATGGISVDSRTGALAGLAINRAERLRSLAGPGQVLLADDTRQLVRRFFEYDDLGVIPVKDFGPTHVWRVAGESSVVSRFDAHRRSDTPPAIVGRDDALARLAAAWRDARAGRGSAVCLIGDAGLGKSRLARAALEQAERDGARVLEIDCTPSTGNSPLRPVGVLLRRTARIGVGASEAEKEAAAMDLLTGLLGAGAAEALGYLGPLFGLESTPLPLDKTREQVRTATIATTVSIVRALASQRPLMLLCEDLHWADDTTAQVVQSVAQAIDDLPAMMIATRWPRPVTAIDLEAITAAFTAIAVDPLPAETAADLVRAVSAGQLPPARVEDIVHRCGGVPLLLEEVTRSAVEQSGLAEAASAVQPSDSAVPPELQLVVESRLGRWPDLRGIVEAASVLGREFPIPVLEAMAPARRADVPRALALFGDQGLFTVPGAAQSDRASFRHGLIRDAVYETLVSRDYLRALHSRAADALVASYSGTPDASPDLVANHLFEAGRLDEALDLRLDAAEKTFKRGAYVEATGHCDAAQRLTDRMGDAVRPRASAFRLSVLRGMVGAGISGYSAVPVELAYKAAEAMFDDETAPAQRYPVVRGLATAYLVRGELATAYRYSREGLELAERSMRSDCRIDAMSVLAYTALYHRTLAECRLWIDRCLSLYEADGGDTFSYPVPQDAKTAALALLPTAAWLQGDPQGAEDAVARGLAHVADLNREFDKALLHGWLAGTRYTQRRYQEALQHAGMAYALGKEHQFLEWEGVGAMMALLSQSALQPDPEAVARAIAAGQEFKARGIGLNASYFLWGIARGLVGAGDSDGARAVLGAALQAAAASEETRMNPEIWMLQAEIESDRSTAIRLLQDACELATRQGAIATALRAAALAVQAVGADAADRQWARNALDLLDGRAAADPARPRWMHEELALSPTAAGRRWSDSSSTADDTSSRSAG